MTEIREFRGEHSFLSNFRFGVLLSAEHIFQAMKGRDWEDQLYVLAAPTPGEAKLRGRSIEKRSDWEEIKEDVMWCVLQIKFAPGSGLAQRLLATGDAELTEGNWWGDDFWGFDFKTDSGANILGKLLMAWRDELKEIEDD